MFTLDKCVKISERIAQKIDKYFDCCIILILKRLNKTYFFVEIVIIARYLNLPIKLIIRKDEW